MIAHVQIRATHGDLLDDERLNKLRELCEELALFNETTIDGWTISVVEAREARCVYEGFLLPGSPGVWQKALRRCPETAVEVVAGSELCAAHAKGARRLMAALERAS